MTLYAGFWLRFVAWLIDRILIGVISAIILSPILAAIGIVSGGSMFPFSDFGEQDFNWATLLATLTAMIGISLFVRMAVLLLYHALMESSKYQASLGKLALGLVVTDVQGNKLDFSKALVRNLCKLISNLTFTIGYIMAGFTDKKQALHDVIAGTLVVRKQSNQ
ncbi:MAG: RDD family protein [Cyclobacteriaceae bacterium]|nr:RDD family protein [Cyclobacteriaceae bacterium]